MAGGWSRGRVPATQRGLWPALKGLAEAATRGDPVPLENRIRLVTGRCFVSQAAWVYSLIRPLRIGFQRICCVDVGHDGAGTVAFVVGDALRDALVRPGGVVVRLVFGQDGVQVLLAGDQHTV